MFKNFRRTPSAWGWFNVPAAVVPIREAVEDTRVRISMADTKVAAAYWNACRSLPVITLERPRQYFQRWRETYHCRVLGTELIFESEAELLYFILKWS